MHLELEDLGEQIIDLAVIYTVKEVKGLEFKEIYVFDRDMTDNEQYIAYTRALVKLNIIKTLGKHVNKDEILYVQGDEETELDN